MSDLPGLQPSDPEKDRNFITALARGLDILRAYRPGETELTNTDFAERTGLPKPTVSRLTYTLCQLDYLAADPRSGGYRLGAGVLQLGFGVLAGMEMTRRAQGVMRALQAGPNSYTTTALAERHRLKAVYVGVLASEEEDAPVEVDDDIEEKYQKEVLVEKTRGAALCLFFSRVVSSRR